MSALGIVAGGGPLPRLVAASALSRGRRVFALGLDGITDDTTPVNRSVPLGAMGLALAVLRNAGVDEVVLAGPVPRPRLGDLRPDARAARLLVRVMLGQVGDDAALRAVIREIEREGIRVIGADLAAPELVAPVGRLGEIEPDVRSLADLRVGIECCRRLGDAGQAVVVCDGRQVGQEGRGGTDELLSTLRGACGGALIKLPKASQDRRVDLPAIGPRTVELSAAAGLRGIFVEAGGALLIDRAELRERADRAGLFLFGIARA